jgi:hypothetical protein
MGIRAQIRLILTLASTAMLLCGCGGSEAAGPSFEVSFDSSLARSGLGAPTRVELYLLDDCGDVTLGERGVPAIATATIVKDGATGRFQDTLRPGEFGLYGVAQDDDCAVVAAGCAPVTIDGDGDVLELALSRFDGTGCTAEQFCSRQSGECVDGTGGSGGAGGVGGAGGLAGAGGMGGTSPTRVADGLIVHYDFDEGSGSTVRDKSGVTPALDLTIDDPGNVTWSGGHLTIDSGTVLRTSGAASKVYANVAASNEISLEAWVRPSSLVSVGTPPDRIVSMSSDSGQRNFLLGQDATNYAVRFRTPGQNNGNPTVATSAASAQLSLTHVVYTHRADGSEVIYIDGLEDTTFERTGDTSTWDASFPLVLGNESDAGREWLGEFHLVAIYDRALSPNEVDQNFSVGP